MEKDEFLHWVNMIPEFSCEMNVTGKRMKVKDIVKEYCYPWNPVEKKVEEISWQSCL